jgi:uridine kinase
LYQVSRSLGLIWLDLKADKWFRVGLAVKLAFVILLNPEIQQKWFLPFLVHFCESPSLIPWTDFLEKGGTYLAFPYGPVMLVSQLPLTFGGWLLDQVFGSQYFVGLGFRLTLLIADLFVLLFLLQQFDVSWKNIITFYWLSPLVLFVTYWHGQIDLIPVALFFIAIGFLKQKKQMYGGISLASAIAAKHSMLIGAPFLFVYLWFNRGLRSGFRLSLFYFVVTLLVLEGALYFSSGFRDMVIQTREADKVFWLALDMGKGLFIYAIPITYLLLLYFALRMKRMNFDLLLATLGVAFSIIVILTLAPPGWFLWLVPIYALHQSRSSGGAIPLVSAFSFFFIFYHLFYSESTHFIGMDVPIISGTHMLDELLGGKFQSLLYTLYTGLTFVIGLQILREGIQGNDYYHMGRKPVVLGIAGDSGVGKTTFAGAISDLFGTISSVHLIGDDYHNWDRASPMWKSMTHLDPRANKIYNMVNDLRCLLNNEAVRVRTYDHKTGRFSPPHLKKSRNVICISGLHAFFTEDLADEMDRRFFLDMDETLRIKLKIKRDTEKRGRSKDFTMSEIARRSEDSKKYIHPQASRADVIFSLMPSNPNLLEEDPEKIKLKLRVKLSRGGYYDDLRRALIGVCGLNINIINIDNKGGVDLDIQGEVMGEDILLASRMLLPHLEELIDFDAGFRNGMLGVMQLIAIVEINEALMQRRRLSNG